MQQKLIPSNLLYQSIELCSYVQLPEVTAGQYFWATGNATTLLPVGYENLSDMVESLAVDKLKNAHSRVTFRLFFLQHGTLSFDRESMEPIFQTTCGLRQGKFPPTAMVFDRDIDEDFAMCVANNDCGRCRPADQVTSVA